MAMRIKLEAVAELASFTSATRSYVSPVKTPADFNVVDVPVYAEKHNTLHVCVPAAIVAASAGATILFHGIETSSAASDLPRLLGELGIPVTSQAPDLPEVLQEKGFAYLDLALYHPPLAKLLALREELGAQNVFHQVARLLNPARAQSQVVGVAHPPYLGKIPGSGIHARRAAPSRVSGDRRLPGTVHCNPNRHAGTAPRPRDPPDPHTRRRSSPPWVHFPRWPFRPRPLRKPCRLRRLR